MKVYRVEDKDGIGPYQIGVKKWWSRNHSDEVHPDVTPGSTGPQDKHVRGPKFFTDLLNESRVGIHCGFLTERDFTSWFNMTERSALKEQGFELSIYEVPEDSVCVLEKQVVFNKKVSKKVDNTPLIEYCL